MRKVFLEKAVLEPVYKFDEKVLPRMFEKVSRSLKYDSNFFDHKHIQVKKKAFKINAKIEDVGLNED